MQNTLLKGWPHTGVILGRQNKRLIGYRVACRFETPAGRKALTYASVPIWLGGIVLASHMTAGMPEGEAGGAWLVRLAVLAVAGHCLLYWLMLGRLALEIRPQVVRWRRWGKWRNFKTGHCEFAICQHDKAGDEQLQEQEKIMDAQYSRSRAKPDLPGHIYRKSSTIALIVRRQQLDIAHVHGQRKALDLYHRLEALLEDIRAREWGS
jgi:hypothetical protein